jgi:dTDP-4-amino-4,6-dideoxygalactose transaminase
VLNMIVKVGAQPVFVDCDLVTRNIDLEQVEAAITPTTRAVIPTHYPGAMVDLDALRSIAARRRLRVIEDAALVMGSRWRGSNVGASGDLVTFSFHPNKNITSIEGGALVVNDDAEAHRVETLRFHGITYLPDRTRDVDFPGGKFNLPDVNARIGCAQLERLPAFLATRRRLVDRYFARLAGRLNDVGCVPPPQPRGADAGADEQSWNMFCILLPLPRMKQTRNDFRDALAHLLRSRRGRHAHVDVRGQHAAHMREVRDIRPTAVARRRGAVVPDRHVVRARIDGIGNETADVAGEVALSGCPDKDKDGIADQNDKCPDVAGTAKYNGCPVPDSDGDGLDDENDKCPAVAGKPENHGCPAIKQEIVKKVNL